MSGLDENSSAFRGRVPMVVSKAPCIVTGDGEDARQELAPKLRLWIELRERGKLSTWRVHTQ